MIRRFLVHCSVAAFLVALTAVPAGARASNARRAENAAHRAAAPPPVALSSIHVLGGLPAPFALEAKSALMIDGRTGAELYAFNEHEKMQPASLAKIMTFYLALQALQQKRITLDTQMPVSEAAWRLSLNDTVSRMFLQVGQRVAVHDLLYGLMVSSGNDAAVVLSEYLGGSSEGFTQQMNDEAQKLGLTETHFANPDGLPVEGEYTTAFDMVKLGRALLERFPDATKYTGTKEFTYAAVAAQGKIRNITQRNFNTLLFYDARVDGIKTGHVNEAGFHLVASAHHDNMLLISAVMGTRSMEKRRVETEKLVDWAFRTFATVHPDWHKTVPSSMRVYKGAADQVAIAPASDSWVTVEHGKESQVKVSYIANEKYLSAPVAKSAKVGEMVVTQGDAEVARIPVVAQSAVPLGGFFKRFGDRMRLVL
jgi:D-alanyl-D-alanine carboxypeptidase (penicillin-binding protein 5/6)